MRTKCFINSSNAVERNLSFTRSIQITELRYAVRAPCCVSTEDFIITAMMKCSEETSERTEKQSMPKCL